MCGCGCGSMNFQSLLKCQPEIISASVVTKHLPSRRFPAPTFSYPQSLTLRSTYIVPENHVYLIDVQALGKTAFTTVMGMCRETIQSILESTTVPKVFFDVRWGSQLLYTHFGITLQGVQDIQLMESASHLPLVRAKRFLLGLGACIQQATSITGWEKPNWEAVHKAMGRLCRPLLGGSSQVFQDRPLVEDTGPFGYWTYNTYHSYTNYTGIRISSRGCSRA